MKFTLNTLGAPGWTLEDAARKAREYGYAGVDLRLIDGEVISLDSVRANRNRLRALFQPPRSRRSGEKLRTRWLSGSTWQPNWACR
jgi:hypothetical protein